jgi:hypothetical protein
MENNLYKESHLQIKSKLILCIEEHEHINGGKSIDTRLFIGLSDQNDDFFVRGKRQDIGLYNFVPYAFHCDTSDELFTFLKFVLGSNRNISIMLYNYNNIDTCNYLGKLKDYELTYEFFEKYMHKDYEIVAYDNVQLKRKHITKYLDMLKNIYNWDY